MLVARAARRLTSPWARRLSSFAPEPLGTTLPDGTRWGAFAGATVSDPAGVLQSSEVEVVASGFRWTEGPVWVQATRSLYFSDTIDARIYRWREAGGVQIVASESGGYDGGNVDGYDELFEPGSNGMALHEGALHVCQHPTRRVVRTSPAALDALDGGRMCDGAFEVLADRTPEGRRLNAPNDVIVAPAGDVYFTDPVYGFLLKQPAGLGYAYLNAEQGLHPDQPYLDERCASDGAGYKGVFRVRGGEVALATALLERPNGLALSRDGALLWVANSAKDAPSWSAFAMSDELPLVHSRTVTEETLGASLRLGEGLSDGFKVDEEERIWSSVPGGVAVIDPRANRVCATVRFDTNISNIQFGEGGDVWVTGLGHVWRLRRKV